MKFRFALVAALLFPLALLAETSRPTSFVGVPWGASPQDAIRILTARAGVTAPAEADAADQLELTGGTFAGQAAATWTLRFSERKLYAASVLLKPATTSQSLYRELKQMLIAKYGPAAGERKPDAGSDAEKRVRRDRRRLNPDEKTHGNVSFWKFSPTLNDKERKLIELELAGPDGGETNVESQLVLTIRYLNESLKPTNTATAASAYKAEPSRAAVKVDDL